MARDGRASSGRLEAALGATPRAGVQIARTSACLPSRRHDREHRHRRKDERYGMDARRCHRFGAGRPRVDRIGVD